jgi:hypothetical protein
LELQLKRSDKDERVSCCCTNVLPLTEPFSEKYLKKLIGRTDIEDALKRLDRLTQEEARMAAAQVLKVVNTVDDRVRGTADNMLGVDNRMAGIDDRIADVGDRLKGVNDQVKGVNDRVKDIDDRVRAVDDKIVEVIDGARYIFNLSSENWLNNNAPRWKRGQDSYATSSRRRRSSETFVISESH